MKLVVLLQFSYLGFFFLYDDTPNHTGFNLNMTFLVIHFFSYLAENTHVPFRLIEAFEFFNSNQFGV